MVQSDWPSQTLSSNMLQCVTIWEGYASPNAPKFGDVVLKISWRTQLHFSIVSFSFEGVGQAKLSWTWFFSDTCPDMDMDMIQCLIQWECYNCPITPKFGYVIVEKQLSWDNQLQASQVAPLSRSDQDNYTF